MNERRIEVAIVGGGPAGAATAINLSQMGVDTVLFERMPAPQWRASGVYSSPLTRERLALLGLPGGALDELLLRVPALVVHTQDGASCRLDYASRGGACGADRVRLDGALLERAACVGAQVITGATVRAIRPGIRAQPSALLVSTPEGQQRWRASIVVGADGTGSLVARSFGVQRSARWLRRAGLTFHLDVQGNPFTNAHMVIGRSWYCGVCPVPGDRVNIGIVLAEAQLRRALAEGDRPVDIARRLLRQLPAPLRHLADSPATDELQVALPLANRVSRRGGRGFLLVGDAAGFIDPISGEGLHRALVSAAYAVHGIAAALRDAGGPLLEDYDQRLHARFRHKDMLSWLLQAFLAHPEVPGYAVRRLGSREDVLRTFANVMADLVRPDCALHPGFLMRLLRP